ncbi:hypothetical protein H8356DRAFT_1624500 [Neocallimastix lanati (nom. inval.)]|nr:hypothetical protein H8356DRAFT_1624500 [Neocallimastix sp. JGI-2020a]
MCCLLFIYILCIYNILLLLFYFIFFLINFMFSTFFHTNFVFIKKYYVLRFTFFSIISILYLFI